VTETAGDGPGAVAPQPPNGELRVVDHVPTAFAGLVAAEAAAAAGRGDGRLRIALSGGDTARTCYERLAEHDELDWGRLDCLFGDERCVPPEDEAANQQLVREALGARFGRLGSFHPMDCAAPSAYAGLLAAQPALDVAHLGLGPDGHTASLFPGSPGLEAPEDEWVVRNFDPSGRNPHERLSLTFGALARFSLAVFTVAGEAKRDALGRVLSGEDLPAARVRAGRVLWLCDREALPEAIGSIA